MKGKERPKKVQVQLVCERREPLKAGEGEGEQGPSTSSGGHPVATKVVVKFTLVNADETTKRKRFSEAAQFISSEKKHNGHIQIEGEDDGDPKPKMAIPLYYDELIFSGEDLPSYGTLFIDEGVLQQEEVKDEQYLDKLSRLLKKKRRRLDNYCPLPVKPTLGKGSAQRNFQSRAAAVAKPAADLSSPEMQAFIEENIRNAEAEMIRRAYRKMVKTEISKHHRLLNIYFRRQQAEVKKIADAAARETKARFYRVNKESQRSQQRMRRLVREMIYYWKRENKGTARIRRTVDREAAEARKREEEKREAKRSKQQLNFLLTQTELFAHFMANKIGYESENPLAAQEAQFKDLDDKEKEVEIEMHKEATKIAETCVSQNRLATETFDHESERLRSEATGGSIHNPITMPTSSDVKQPLGLKGQLKGYQLKGLQWLAEIYECGLNCILADEMGLGKTIQSIAFLAYLAEEKNIRGPFLVVAPGSTLHNWDREIQAFYPKFRVLPYWGNKVQRRDIRPCIHPKKLFEEDSHNVIVTSYDIVLKDEMQLKRIKWQYMILDEAQAIKNSDSFRWKTLLSFNCRNRLLLTGTPIQNSMTELWALLHFIMPNLFDSYQNFTEWFIKGIEGHAFGQGALDKEQLERLHKVINPFMLRRVKKDVENDMPKKKEITVPCQLTKRQNELYRRIRNKISIVDLFQGKSSLSEGKVLNLMNIVMQLRKVCNHPELFEAQKEITPYHFARINPPLVPAPWGEKDWAWCSGHHSLIAHILPRLVYDEGMICLPSCQAGHLGGPRSKLLNFGMNILESSNASLSTGLSFLALIGLCPSEIVLFSRLDSFQKWYYSRKREKMWSRLRNFYKDYPSSSRIGSTFTRSMLKVDTGVPKWFYRKNNGYEEGGGGYSPLVQKGGTRILSNALLLKALGRHIERVRAVPQEIHCASSGFEIQHKRFLQSDWEQQVLFGLTNHQSKFWVADGVLSEIGSVVPYSKPLLSGLAGLVESGVGVKFYSLAKALADGGKLQALDKLIRDLKAGGHKVLVFCQMTNMMNLIEEYMNFRKLRYLRLDGSSQLEDRRDMVDAFQSEDDIFAFLLSTRAGGLGINLTAADTVIFYDSDWNPTIDQQAMDRAHRLGQTKEVTVYRFVCQGTIEEKIIKRAQQKSKIQTTVMQSFSEAPEELSESKDVVSLLFD